MVFQGLRDLDVLVLSAARRLSGDAKHFVPPGSVLQLCAWGCVRAVVFPRGTWSSAGETSEHPWNSSDVKGSEPGKLFPMVYSTSVDSGCKRGLGKVIKAVNIC